ncbi:MAG: hypothetical protein ACXW05_17450 [Gemmatirosa sp.]
MTTIIRAARHGAAALLLLATGACAGVGNVGEILGSVLGGGAGASGSQVTGTVRGVDTRAQQIGLQLSNGQTVGLAFDDKTQVVYNNQNYAVTSLDPGDQVTARVQSTNDGAYYTDLVQVDQPVQNTGGSTATSGSATVQTLQGTVRQIDQSNGLFALQTNGGTVTVSLPYNVSRSDQNRFQSLRTGDSVRLQGVFLNNTRVELRQFN